MLLAAVLRARGDRTPVDPADEAAWEAIKNEWPILSTADSLFALQAMLRLVLLLSAILRPASGRSTLDVSPLSGTTALFYALAGSVRALLLFFSPDHSLEGPLSGPIYVAFEVASLPLLLKLALGTLTSSSWRPFALLLKLLGWFFGVALSALLASQNRLPLAGDAFMNGAFTMVSLLELVAAIACLLQTVCCSGGGAKGTFSSMAHVVLPIQQSLSMYFFLTAFDMSLERASVGKPLQLLQLAGIVEVALLLLAGLAHWVLAEDATEAEQDNSQQPLPTTVFTF